MKITPTEIPEVFIVEPKMIMDPRGFFLEHFQADRYSALGVKSPIVQDNMSRSSKGVLRGLHFQNPNAQGKLVGVMRGRVLDVAVDVRLGSPTFGRHVAVELGDDNFSSGVDSPGLRAWLHGTNRNRRFLLQVRRVLQPLGRNDDPVGRSGVKHRWEDTPAHPLES